MIKLIKKGFDFFWQWHALAAIMFLLSVVAQARGYDIICIKCLLGTLCAIGFGIWERIR